MVVVGLWVGPAGGGEGFQTAAAASGVAVAEGAVARHTFMRAGHMEGVEISQNPACLDEEYCKPHMVWSWWVHISSSAH